MLSLSFDGIRINDCTGPTGTLVYRNIDYAIQFAPVPDFSAACDRFLLHYPPSMAMGAHGVWTGSVWLTTKEAETSPVIIDKLLSASSNQTVRSKSRTGKYSRQIRSPWTDAWESGEAPEPLPMPLQSQISEPALGKVTKLAEGGHAGAKQLATFWVGQGVGLMNQSLSSKQVVYDFMEDFLAANERLKGIVDE